VPAQLHRRESMASSAISARKPGRHRRPRPCICLDWLTWPDHPSAGSRGGRRRRTSSATWTAGRSAGLLGRSESPVGPFSVGATASNQENTLGRKGFPSISPRPRDGSPSTATTAAFRSSDAGADRVRPAPCCRVRGTRGPQASSSRWIVFSLRRGRYVLISTTPARIYLCREPVRAAYSLPAGLSGSASPRPTPPRPRGIGRIGTCSAVADSCALPRP
jgi:hypothetical protein